MKIYRGPIAADAGIPVFTVGIGSMGAQRRFFAAMRAGGAAEEIRELESRRTGMELTRGCLSTLMR